MKPSSYRERIRGLFQNLGIPRDEILFLHVRLKDLRRDEPYGEASKILAEELVEAAWPKTILVPTFTYSFTKNGVYDRVNTGCEVGRFGEEVRQMARYEKRTLNPVFNVVDTMGYVATDRLDESTAFGPDSLIDVLARQNYVIVNINLPSLISTHLHYVEYSQGVDYRFDRQFRGRVSVDGQTFEDVEYTYFVRDLDMDTKWRREKIKAHLIDRGRLVSAEYDGVEANWIYSHDVDEVIGAKLEEEPRFLITD